LIAFRAVEKRYASPTSTSIPSKPVNLAIPTPFLRRRRFYLA
jgi:hypothetical protein